VTRCALEGMPGRALGRHTDTPGGAQSGHGFGMQRAGRGQTVQGCSVVRMRAVVGSRAVEGGGAVKGCRAA
jgi:hypothetical protein